MSSPEIQIEDLSEEKLFLRKKTIQKSTKPVHQIKDQKLSLIKNLLQEISKDENEETDQLQIEILLQMIKKIQKNQPIGKLQEKSKSGEDTNIQIVLLQKQITNIKANIAKKINQVLKIISQKKTPTYAEIASKNLPIPQIVITKKPANQLTSQAGNPTTVQKKPAEKSREKSAYKERRLILQISKNFIKNLNAMQIRDQVNDTFFKEEGETQPTIVIITKSQSNQSIVITTMPNFSVKYLVEKKEVWKNIISYQKVYADKKWVKIVIYTVLIRSFSTDDGLYLLGQEIEIFNPGMKLMKIS